MSPVKTPLSLHTFSLAMSACMLTMHSRTLMHTHTNTLRFSHRDTHAHSLPHASHTCIYTKTRKLTRLAHSHTQVTYITNSFPLSHTSLLTPTQHTLNFAYLTHTCMHTLPYMHSLSHLSKHTFILTNIHTCMQPCPHTYPHACIHMCAHILALVFTFSHVHTSIHILRHTHIHTCVFSCTHSHIQTCNSALTHYQTHTLMFIHSLQLSTHSDSHMCAFPHFILTYNQTYVHTLKHTLTMQ